jgi:predicted Zn-dependent peptidase
MFTIHAATGAEMMDELIRVVGEEMRRGADGRPSEPETARAKAQLKAGLLMSLESASARAEQMARQLLSLDRLLPTEELMQRVDGVSPTSVQAFAATLLTSPPSVAVVGAGRNSEAFASRAAEAAAVAA